MKLHAKEQPETGAVLNRVQEVIAVNQSAQLTLAQKQNHGTAKMKAHAKLQERAGALQQEVMDIVQAPAQPAKKIIHGTAIQKKHAPV